jgi:hypothetical protein
VALVEQLALVVVVLVVEAEGKVQLGQLILVVVQEEVVQLQMETLVVLVLLSSQFHQLTILEQLLVRQQ